MSPAFVTDELQAALEGFRSSRGIPGLTAAVLPEGAESWGAVGVADPEGDQPMTSATHFAIGSMTKSFVAALALRLVERGHLALHDPIALYVSPETANSRRSSAVRLRSKSQVWWMRPVRILNCGAGHASG